MRRGEPALLRNSSLLVPGSIPGWGDAEPHENSDSLSLPGFAASGSRDERAWRVMLSSSRANKKNRYYPLASDATSLRRENAIGDPYRVRNPETSLTRLTAAEFAQCAQSWKKRGAYFEDEVAEIGQDGVVKAVDGGEGLGDAAVDAIDWNTVRDLIQVPQKFGTLKSVLLGAGTKDSVLPFHVPLTSSLRGGAATTDKKKTLQKNANAHAPDTQSGLLDAKPSRVVKDTHGLEVSEFDIVADCAAKEALDEANDDSGFETVQVQIRGRRRVTLVSPAMTYSGMYPFETSHPLDGRSAVDWSDVDYERFPHASTVRGCVAILNPGDALFVPEAYWRHEHGLSNAHAHAQLRFARSATDVGSRERDLSAANALYRVPPSLAVGRPRTAAASVFFVGRAVEKLVCESEGERDARHWIEVCARREENQWLDLSSPADVRRVDLFRRVREFVDRGLPPPRVPVDAFRAALWKEFKPPPRSFRDDNAVVRASGSGTKDVQMKTEDSFKLFALTAPPKPSAEVSLLACATERETRGAGRHERFLLRLIDGRMFVDDPHPSWVDDDFVDPVLVSEAKKLLLEKETENENEEEEGVSSSSHDVLPSDENALLEALKNPHDPRSLRVALPDGGVLTSFAKRLPDDRTDVERAFPEMFVEKLVKKGWSETKHTPLSVLNPEHPQFVGKKQQKP
jgi:hypothetical protein